MRSFRIVLAAVLAVLAMVGAAGAADPSWPKEVTFGLLSTENASEITRRWGPILAQLEKDLGVKVKSVTATDYRGTIEALKFKKAEIGHLGPKAYVEASTNNYANVEPVAQLQLANGSLGYRSCLIVHADSDLFSPEDMAGKTFAFNDRGSTSGYLVPSMFFMTEMGIDPGTMVLGMILDTLSGRSPLYRLEEFFAHQDTALLLGQDLAPDALHDDTVGRVLERLYDVGTMKIFTACAGRADQAYGLDKQYVHCDTTSISVYGDYLPPEGPPDQQAPAVPFTITHG